MGILIREQLLHQVCAVKQTVLKGFALVGGAEAAAQVKDGVVIVQGKGFQKRFQFFETIADFWWIGFVGFAIGLVELIQNGFSIAAPRVKGMVVRIDFQCFGNG